MSLVPATLLAAAARGPAWAAWLDTLPGVARELLEEWDLTVDGAATHGHGSLVVPVRAAAGEPAVLKVAFADPETSPDTEQEHLALQHWHGRGAVRLLRADPHRHALLLERVHTRDLTDHWDVEACEIVADLYGRLHVPAPPRMRTLRWYVDRWIAPLHALPRDAPIPHRLVEQTISLARDLLADPGPPSLLHGDLHYENVLAADREPWLVIDPQPKAGDPHWEPAPMLWNRWDEMAGDIRGGLRRRFHTIVDAAGLEEERARDWMVVRMVIDAHWSIEDAERLSRALNAKERDWITRCITIAKAVQD